MKTNTELVKFSEKALRENWGYCLGSFGNILTQSFLNQKLNQGAGVGSYNKRHLPYLRKFMGKRVTDCYGLVKAFVWWTGENTSPRYSPSQDRNQEGAFNRAKEKGLLKDIPEIPGLVLWMRGHAGVYIGNGEFIECVGAPVGMRKGKISNGRIVSGSRFTHWFKDTYIKYPLQVKNDIIRLRVRGKTLSVNGKIENGTTYILVDGKYVGLRAFFEKLGMVVGWDNNTRTVTVD